MHDIVERRGAEKLSVQSLDRRVRILEADMGEVKGDVTHIKENTENILAIIQTSKSVAGFIRKAWPHMVTFAVSAGIFSKPVGTLITNIFGG